MAKFLRCIKNDGLPEYFRLGDIFECEEYDKDNYKVKFKDNDKILTARINKEYFSVPDMEQSKDPITELKDLLNERQITLFFCSSYLTNLQQILSKLYFNKDEDTEVLGQKVAERTVEAMAILELLVQVQGLEQEDIDNYKNVFLKNMIKNIKEDKILI